MGGGEKLEINEELKGGCRRSEKWAAGQDRPAVQHILSDIPVLLISSECSSLTKCLLGLHSTERQE